MNNIMMSVSIQNITKHSDILIKFGKMIMTPLLGYLAPFLKE